MKKIAIILMLALMLTALVACTKDEKAEILSLDQQTDPTLNITKCYDVPYQFDLSKYIDISKEDYTGVEFENVSASITDDDLTNAIYVDLAEHATYNDVDRGAQEGDSLNINFTGMVDGIKFDGGAAENYDLILGEAGFIDGFEDALVGHKAGEEFVIDVTFPENYGKEDLNGKPAQFEIKMNSVKEMVLPELTDAFVKEKFGSDNVEAYLQLVNERLTEDKSADADGEKKSNAYAAVYDNVKIKDYPEEEYKYYYDDFVNYYKEMASYYGVSLEELLPQMGTDEEEFYSYAEQNAVINVEQELICFAIANNEKLWQNLTKGDYNAYLDKVAKQNDMEPADFEEEYGDGAIWKSLILDKAISFVIDNGTAVDPDTEEKAENTTTSEEAPEATPEAAE